jgi:hypothetical protein
MQDKNKGSRKTGKKSFYSDFCIINSFNRPKPLGHRLPDPPVIGYFKVDGEGAEKVKHVVTVGSATYLLIK